MSADQGSSCTAQPLPSGSLKKMNLKPGLSTLAQLPDLAHLDAPADELRARCVDVGDDQLEASDGARLHLRQPFADHDRAGRPRRRQLDDARLGAGPGVVVRVEAELLGVEGLGAIHVGHGHHHDLESVVHRHARCSESRSNALARPAAAASRSSSLACMVVWKTISVRPSPRSVNVTVPTAPS